MRNSTLLFNYANNRPHNSISLEQVCFLEGVSFIFNQICKKCTKLGKNITLFVHLSAAKSCKKCKYFSFISNPTGTLHEKCKRLSSICLEYIK